MREKSQHSLVEFEGMADVNGLHTPIRHVVEESISSLPTSVECFSKWDQHLHSPNAVSPCDVDVEAGFVGQTVEVVGGELSGDLD